MAGRILVVDDEKEWRDEIKTDLEESGYEVCTASSYDEGMLKICGGDFHVIIGDICLVPGDDANEDGLRLVEDAVRLDPEVAAIVLTGFGTLERTKRAYGAGGVFEVLDKGAPYDGRKLAAAVAHALKEGVRINFYLNIDMSDDINLEESAITLDDHSTLTGSQLQDESIELVQKLHHTSNEIRIERLGAGRNAANVFKIFPPKSIGKVPTTPLITKIGRRGKLLQEKEKFDELVAGSLGEFVGGKLRESTILNEFRCTRNLAGVNYSLTDCDLQQVVDFETLYHRDSTGEEVERVVENLFIETLNPWYENRTYEPIPLYDEYATYVFTLERLKEEIESIAPGLTSEENINIELGGDAPPLSFSNPISSFSKLGLGYCARSCRAVVHGDLNEGNVLADADGRVWLIGFNRVHHGHILKDFVKLESVVKFQLMDTEDLAAIHEFERALSSQTSFSAEVGFDAESAGAEIAKACSTVKKIREMARIFVAPNDDMAEYHIGLLYHALHAISYDSLAESQRQYAIMSAAILCEKFREL